MCGYARHSSLTYKDYYNTLIQPQPYAQSLRLYRWITKTVANRVRDVDNTFHFFQSATWPTLYTPHHTTLYYCVRTNYYYSQLYLYLHTYISIYKYSPKWGLVNIRPIIPFRGFGFSKNSPFTSRWGSSTIPLSMDMRLSCPLTTTLSTCPILCRSCGPSPE